MLNRRTLRIKIMQSLFAFEQCKEANYELALDQIEAYFEPDLNSMEVQDKELLKGRRKQARQLLDTKFSNPNAPDGPDDVVNQAVKASLIVYHKEVKKDFQSFSKNMVLEVEKINELYFSVLGLLTALAETAVNDKRSDYKNFVHNCWIEAITGNSELRKLLLKSNFGWHNRMDKVRSWFRDVIKTDAEFQKFIQQKSPSIEEQKFIVKHLVRKLILGDGPINSHFEEEDLHWTEDQDIVKSLVEKTIKSWSEDSPAIELQKLSLDWEDDRKFMGILFSGVIGLDEQYKQLIARNTKNWEVDRLPLTDRIIFGNGHYRINYVFTHPCKGEHQ